MAITISGENSIDMGDKPISNVSIINQDSVVDKAYVDDLKIIATGTATFTATTNNINLTGIGVGVEIGDVIQISGAEDSKNNSEFTIEVITDANNIIVNQAHANKGTQKNVANRASDTGVTVKLLAKWYNASNTLGRHFIYMRNVRAYNIDYINNTGRDMDINYTFESATAGMQAIVLQINGNPAGYTSSYTSTGSTVGVSASSTIPKGATYKFVPAGSNYLGNAFVFEVR